MNSDYEQSNMAYYFSGFMDLIRVPISSSYIWMDSRLKGLSIECKNIKNGVRTKKL